MNTDSSPYPDKTERHDAYDALSRLRSSIFIQNEYFGKIRRELRSEGTKTEEQRRDLRASGLAVLSGSG
jgi:hypothetical protein